MFIEKKNGLKNANDIFEKSLKMMKILNEKRKCVGQVVIVLIAKDHHDTASLVLDAEICMSIALSLFLVLATTLNKLESAFFLFKLKISIFNELKQSDTFLESGAQAKQDAMYWTQCFKSNSKEKTNWKLKKKEWIERLNYNRSYGMRRACVSVVQFNNQV